MRVAGSVSLNLLKVAWINSDIYVAVYHHVL